MHKSKRLPPEPHSLPTAKPQQGAIHFGAFVRVLRHRQGIRQLQVLAHLPGWTQATYSRVETGELSPAFDQLAAIYTALGQAGVEFTPQDRQQFLTLARLRIGSKKTYLDRKSDQEWAELRLRLSQMQHDIEDTSPQEHHVARTHLVETRHLVGREDWLASVIASLRGSLPKKLVVLQGPVGIGKSSELHRIALHFLSVKEQERPHILLCALPTMEEGTGSENALDLIMGTVLADLFPTDTALQKASLATRSQFMLKCLGKMTYPLLVLVDNAECLLNTQGQIASCWKQFLQEFLRSQHQASLVLATREWPGWFEGERVFLAERRVPALSIDDGAVLLQRLGLAALPVTELRRASDVVGGVPLCLEWVASLVQEPMWLDSWEDSDNMQEGMAANDPETAQIGRLRRLLDDTSLFGGPIASKLTPLLERIIDKRLSQEAVQVLRVLALADMPLGKPALQSFCPRPRLLKELSTVSLLVSYPTRIQLLPMVAAQVRTQLGGEERHRLEELLIEAYWRWLNEGTADIREMGSIVAELAILYLRKHRLLDAAQLVIGSGWISFSQGYAPRIARFTLETLDRFDWHKTEELECGGLLLYYVLAPYLGKSVDMKQRYSDYQRIQQAVIGKKVILAPLTDGHVTNDLMQYHMHALRFEEAQALMQACDCRLEPLQKDDVELQVSLLEKHAWFCGKWCEYVHEQGYAQKANEIREEAISFYRQCVTTLLSLNEKAFSAKRFVLSRRLSRAYNNLGYHLYRMRQFEKALEVVEKAIILREQGYAEVAVLAASYGQKSEILVELGRFREAALFNEKALAEIQKWADSGYTLSQEEVWIYHVNHGKLCLRIGKVDVAEQWLLAALPNIHPRRRTYRMFAEEALGEIEQWRKKTVAHHYQLDWRWVERLRELDAFDAYWWLAHAGSFTEAEQKLWNQLYTSSPEASIKKQLASLIAQSRERELAQAIAEQREPCFTYPALDSADVARRIHELLELDHDVLHEEPNTLVRRLYHEKIEEEVCFLRMIQATSQKDNEQFQKQSCCVYPAPTSEEVEYVLSQVWDVIEQGLQREETQQYSHQLIQFMNERLHLAHDFSHIEAAKPLQYSCDGATVPVESQRKVSAHVAKQFFEMALRESGYEGWQVVIDQASTTRVESGLRQVILADTEMPLERVRYYLIHELGGHVARAMAGERSMLGLLGIGTKNYAPTEEGLAAYQERLIAEMQGQPVSAWGTMLGTLSTGLASGVMTPPQTFMSLFTFLESFFLLRRLLNQQDTDETTAQQRARKTALANCLRTFRGVPDLQQPGVCFTKDAIYLHGLWMIERAVAQDATVLDRLAIGKTALEYLPLVQELGIEASPMPLTKLAYAPDLYDYMQSFAPSEKETEKHA